MLTSNEFKRIVRYVKARSGIDLSEKQVLVAGRLENYLARNGYSSYDEYMEVVEKSKDGKEATNLINALTTNHTFFMRESEHFEYMRAIVLPQLKVSEAMTKDLRIWSAACSSGEEPYVLAMYLKEFFGLDYQQWDTKVLATDISTKVLEHAIRGEYLKEQLQPIPDKWKLSHFRAIGPEQFRVRDELKKEVIFRQFNLMNPFPFKRRFHIVFLRNVMIYFEDDVKYRLVQKIYDFMEPGGYLFIGTTESLDREKTAFQYIQPSIYRKV